jgi:hypothetical protein
MIEPVMIIAEIVMNAIAHALLLLKEIVEVFLFGSLLGGDASSDWLGMGGVVLSEQCSLSPPGLPAGITAPSTVAPTRKNSPH